MARRWWNSENLCIILYEAPDCDKGQVCWPPCDSVFIPMYNKMVYKQTWKIKKIGSVSAKTDSPVSFLSCSPLSWLNYHLKCGYSPSLLILPGLLRSDRGGLSASSLLGEWKDACDLHRWWLVFHVNQLFSLFSPLILLLHYLFLISLYICN